MRNCPATQSGDQCPARRCKSSPLQIDERRYGLILRERFPGGGFLLIDGN